MKRVLLAVFTIVFCFQFASAQTVSFVEPPVGCAPYLGAFSNFSSGLDSLIWDFNDGTPTVSSMAPTVNHTFANGGNFEVTATGWSGGAVADAMNRAVMVSGFPILNNVMACPGDKIRLEANVFADSYLWDSGDGNQQTDAYFWYEYSSTGVYVVTLDLDFSNAGCGTYQNTINVGVTNSTPMDYGYFYSENDTLCVGDAAIFRTNWYMEYFIDYGDGDSYASSSNNTFDAGMTHHYGGAGTYYASITVINGCGLDTTMIDTVLVSTSYSQSPIAEFYFQTGDTACPSALVQMYHFSDASSITVDFGDGTVDSNPAATFYHTYLVPGTYEIVLDVVNGCGNANQFVDTLYAVAGLPFGELSSAGPDSVCFGGSIFVQGDSDDRENTTFSWDFDDGTVEEGVDATHEYSALGTYNVELTATNACETDSVIVQQVVVSNSYGFGAQNFIMVLPEKGCAGDTVIIIRSPAGGNTFQIDYGAGFVAENFQSLDFGSGMTFDVMKHAFTTSGIHNFAVQTTNSCGFDILDSLSVNFNGSNDVEPDFIYDLNAPICIGSPMTFYPVGAKYYTWDFGDGTGISSSEGMLISVQHTFNEPGSYNVVITGRDMCGSFGSDTVLVEVPDTRIIVTANAINSTCGNNDGLALASVAGGTAPFSFSWTSGDTTIIADSLTSGIYQINVTDAIGCTSFDIATISDAEAATIVVSAILDVSCAGGEDGAIDINLIGGDAPFTYVWSNGKLTEDVNQLVAGPYEVSVTDANGCVATESITVSEPGSSSISFAKKNSDCGLNNGFATVFVAGSTGPYTFVWSTGSGSSTITALTPGIYEVNVIDGNGCLLTDEIIIDDIQGPKVFLDSISDLDCGGAGSNIGIAVFGGAAPYNFNWSNGATTPGLVGVGVGEYTLVVSDQNSCEANLVVSIDVDPPADNQTCMVTVDTLTNTNQVVWEKADSVGIMNYNIYRESSLSGLYYLVGTVDADSTSFYTDPVADPFIQSWRYKVSVVNDCGIESNLSAIHKTIHLTSNLGVGGVVNLIWDHYEGFSYPTYHVWRFTDVDGWNNIASISSLNTSYTDVTSPVGASYVGYMIQIDPPAICSATKANTDFNSSRSNRASAVGTLAATGALNDLNTNISHLKIYPNPNNGTFNVEMNFINSENAVMQIFDVAGKLVYEKALVGNGIMLQTVQLKYLNSGLYTLTLKSESSVMTQKLIINN
jgi:PKD repeat protein